MKAISSMATRHVLTDLLAAAVAEGLAPVDVESVGGVDAAFRVANGEKLDLIFLASDALAKLGADGHVSRPIVPLMLSQTAVAVPAGTSSPASRSDGTAFTDASELRDALRAATCIGYSTGPSGIALVKMIDTWGLTEEIGDRLVQARPGIPVAASLAVGDIDLGFQQLSELVDQPGIRILGVMPDDCAINTFFSGAVGTASADSGSAAEVLTFLASEATAPIKALHNFSIPVFDR